VSEQLVNTHAHLWVCTSTLPCELGKPHQCQKAPEIREAHEPDGSLDDLVVDGGIRMFHIERMDTGHWWFAVYLTDGTRLSFNLRSGRRISAHYEHE
jgi:hypothetical protein